MRREGPVRLGVAAPLATTNPSCAPAHNRNDAVPAGSRPHASGVIVHDTERNVPMPSRVVAETTKEFRERDESGAFVDRRH